MEQLIEVATSFSKVVEHPSSQWCLSLFKMCGSAIEFWKCVDRFTALGQAVAERIRRDINRCSYDKMLRCCLAFSKAEKAAEQSQGELPSVLGGNPELVKECTDQDLYPVSFVQLGAAFKKNVSRNEILIQASASHVVTATTELEKLTQKVEDLGDGFQMCHPETCWKKDLSTSESDMNKVLTIASATVNTLDPKTMDTEMNKLTKAGAICQHRRF